MKTENTAQRLKKEWNVEVKHQLYSRNGTAYEKLKEFPGALFDQNGYIIFKTKEEYFRCPVVSINKKVSIHGGGISNIPGYISIKSKWTDEEYYFIIKKYLSLLQIIDNGQIVEISDIKNRVYDNKLIQKPENAIQLKLQNISYILIQFCKPYIKEIKPLSSNRPEIDEKIIEILSELDYIDKDSYEPTSDEQELNKKVQKLLKSPLVGKPAGKKSPSKSETSISKYLRDPLVKAWILQNANGECELCDNPSPFYNSENEPYLESHHVKLLSDSGPDTIENAVALCPNCHRACHYANDKHILKEKLLSKIGRLIQI